VPALRCGQSERWEILLSTYFWPEECGKQAFALAEHINFEEVFEDE